MNKESFTKIIGSYFSQPEKVSNALLLRDDINHRALSNEFIRVVEQNLYYVTDDMKVVLKCDVRDKAILPVLGMLLSLYEYDKMYADTFDKLLRYVADVVKIRVAVSVKKRNTKVKK